MNWCKGKDLKLLFHPLAVLCVRKVVNQFLHCSEARKLSCKLLIEADFAWVLPKRHGELTIKKPIGFGNSKMAVVMWNSLVLAIVWVI